MGYERVEGSRKYPGKRSNVKRQVDVTAYRTDGKKILVECKLHKRPVDVEYMEAFYYKIHRDVGADGGLMVSSVGFTEGATGVADAEEIGMATLNPDATEHEYLLEIAGQLWRAISFTDVALVSEEFTATGVINFVEQVAVSEEFICTGSISVVDYVVVSEEVSLESVPVEHKEDELV